MKSLSESKQTNSVVPASLAAASDRYTRSETNVLRVRIASVICIVSVFSGVPALRAATDFDILSSPTEMVIRDSGRNYSTSFGTVNALAIGSPTGNDTAAFAIARFNSTTNAFMDSALFVLNSLAKVVQTASRLTQASAASGASKTFAHPAILQAEDSAAGNAPFRSISIKATSQTQVGNTFVNRSINARYTGLFVANTNGPLACNGHRQGDAYLHADFTLSQTSIK